MLRALVWKEWREQRSLMLAGVALAAVLPLLMFTVAVLTMPRFNGQRLADVTVLAFALLLWPMFATAAGAGTFANESTGRTFGFLVSRPVSRSRIWLAKVGLAAVATLVVVAASWLVAQLLNEIVGTPAAAGPAVAAFTTELRAVEPRVLGPAGLVLCFGAAVFLSARVARPFAAAIGALAVSGLVLVMLIALWPRLGLIADFRSTWMTAEVLAAGMLMLLLSLRRFVTAEPSATSSWVRTAAMVTLVLLATAALGATPAIYADVFADLDRAITREFAMSYGGEVAVVTGAHYPSMMPSLWRLPDMAAGDDAFPQAPLRLTRAVAFSPFFAGDEQWVYYFSARRLLGAVGSSVDLRAVRVDGSEDRLVIDDMDAAWAHSRGLPRRVSGALLSPDGTRVAFSSGWWGPNALVVDVASGRHWRITEPVVDTELDLRWITGTVVAWASNDDIVLHVRGRNQSGDGRHAIVVHNLDTNTGGVRVELPNSGDTYFGWGLWPPTVSVGPYVPGPRIPVQTRDYLDADRREDRFELGVVDTQAGVYEVLESFPCGYPGAAISSDGVVVAHRRYGACVEEEDGDLVGTDPMLVMRNLDTGAAAVVDAPGLGARLPGGSISYIGVSPRGARVSLFVGEEYGPSEFRIFGDDGSSRTLNLRRFVDGVLRGPRATPRWIGEDRLLVRYSARVSTVFLGFGAAIVFDANDGSVLHRYEIPPTRRGPWRRDY